MCEQDRETEDSETEAKDAYDEFEERMGRVGITVVASWNELEISERIGHIIALATLLAPHLYAAYTVNIYTATKQSAEAATVAARAAKEQADLDIRALEAADADKKLPVARQATVSRKRAVCQINVCPDFSRICSLSLGFASAQPLGYFRAAPPGALFIDGQNIRLSSNCKSLILKVLRVCCGDRSGVLCKQLNN
jgi:hypothetical protein